MGGRHEETFLQGRYVDGQWTHEKILNITNHQGNAKPNQNEISPHKKKQVLARMWSKGNPHVLWVGV